MLFTSHAQGAGKWADKDDPMPKRLIEMERTWATLACDAGANRVASAEAL